jgi:hypothetical protein
LTGFTGGANNIALPLLLVGLLAIILMSQVGLQRRRKA